jgi:hypothetical protein
MTFLILIAAVAWTSLAQQTEWGQCGGEGYTGTATCVKGAVCSALNIYYSMNQSLLRYAESNFSDN